MKTQNYYLCFELTDMDRTHKTKPDIREAFSFSEDKLVF